MDKNEEYRGYSIEIYLDPEPQNPREWDNLGKMACSRKNDKLGDDMGTDYMHCRSWEDMGELLAEEYHPSVILPLYLYKHSGITMSTSPFSCIFDSFPIGYIFATRADILKAYKRKRLSKKLKEEVRKGLQSEVDVYDSYITGMVYGYSITDKDGQYIDGCSGYYGYDGDTDALSDAKACIDAMED